MTDDLAARLFRPEVASLTPYNAGLGVEEVRRRYRVERVAKLGSNESALGPSPAAAAALRDPLVLQHYPDRRCTRLRAALAERLRIDPDALVFGNGSEDTLETLCRAVVRPGDEVVVAPPTFQLYGTYAAIMGGVVRAVPRRRDMTVPPDAMIAAFGPRTRVVVLCSPNNPTGTIVPAADLRRIAEALPDDALLICDEAYREFVDDPEYPDSLAELARSGKAWVVLRTFSKAYGLAGLRIGYGVLSHPELAPRLDLLHPPFNVNVAAQAAAYAALHDEEHLRRCVGHNLSERARVDAGLRRLGFAPLASEANFLFFDCGRDGVAFAEALLERGVVVKPWLEPGFTHFVRVSIGTAEDNAAFLGAVRAVAA